MRIRTILITAFAAAGVLAAIFIRGRAGDSATQAARHPRDAAALDARTGSAPDGFVPTPARARAAAGSHRSSDVIGSSDPKAPAYDPVVLMKTSNMTPAEILQKEPRDPAFADAREAALRDTIGRRLHERLAFATDLEVNCRTSSCEINVKRTNANDDLSAVLSALAVSDLGAEATQIGPISDAAQLGGTSVVVLYEAALRDPARYDRVLRAYEAHDGSH